jgi:uncharacterized low-complexity protein
MKKFNKAPFAVAMGSAVLSSFAIHVQADSNPFALNELSGGYMVAEADAKTRHAACGSNTSDGSGKPVSSSNASQHKAGDGKKTEGSCGEGMCGGMMSGGKMKPGMEHNCGAMMKGHEGACGMMGGMNHDDKAAKGKADEGSCGAMMGGGNKSASEHSCGAMMKGGEGSCGSKVDSDKAAGH